MTLYPPRLIDVARRAGVSKATASRTFTGNAVVNEQTRQRVLEAARALGYTYRPRGG